ncbi:MAG: hypothetical protein ABI954_13740 [Pyrinomonadaceae bacterium]
MNDDIKVDTFFDNETVNEETARLNDPPEKPPVGPKLLNDPPEKPPVGPRRLNGEPISKSDEDMTA